MIAERVRKIKNALPPGVVLLAATKTRSVEEIREAVDAGIRVIGENYVQEAYRKKPELDREVEWHLIGHLQKNKVKKACEIFDVLQTIDSEELARLVNKRCKTMDRKMPVFIEINSGREEQKHGVMPEHALELADAIYSLEAIELAGVMTMGPALKPEQMRPYFRLTAEIFQELRKRYSTVRYLSMGMSDSWRVAIEEGANMIRIGTGIFGPRKIK
ncbi:MAG: YggS family pyridoxal phosphate-dependent enzyme [Euryarchaeota archaeon]|nr:YggS family pyridoxal phosphate-dependent enzyme [Euryarchaeota archaeon]